MKKPFLFPIFLVIAPFLYAQNQQAEILTDCYSNTARVVFFRPFRFLGSPLRFNLYTDDTLRTRLPLKKFFVVEMKQGTHKITGMPVSSTLRISPKNQYITVEPGKVYFVRCRTTAVTGSQKTNGSFRSDVRMGFNVLKGDEINKVVRRGFVKRKLRKKLYRDFTSQYNHK